MKPSCPPSCKLKCSLQINDKEGSEILLRFRKLGNIEKQRKYIGDHMEAIRPKYRYVTTTSNKKPRGLNNAFYLWVGDRKVRVCKQFFINTLDISERKIRTVMSKKYKSENAVLEEQWKKQGQCHDRLDEYIKDDIKNHIMTRMKINDEDISSQTKRSNYKIIDLHRDYVAHCESRKILSSNYATYDKIFKELNASATKLKRKRIPKYSFK